jgi:hypothetical protein
MSLRWTFEDYVHALESQLVGQYMRHRSSRIGLLVIVLQRRRRWEVQGQPRIDFHELINRLQDRASNLMQADAGLYLRVVGIDATEPQRQRRP